MVKKRSVILVVDDSEINRSMLADMLGEEYSILEAANGSEAVTLLNRHRSSISLVLLDIVMPVMDGFEVLAYMNKAGFTGNIPVITISAEKSPVMIEHAYDLGAVEYINRPFDPKTVRRRVNNTIMLYSKQKKLENMVTEQLLQKEKSNLIMLEVLSHIVEFRNGESGLHVLNIRVATEKILKKLAATTDRYNLTPAKISMIANASALHDIGKISIPEEILNKPGRLTKEEYEIMKTHSAIGAKMLESTSYYKSEELVKVGHDICRWHHERFDGCGYPDGLKGNRIPIAAQVVGIADVYDALTHERVYKPAFSHEDALKMIIGGECGAFNPLLLDALAQVGDELKTELKINSAGGISRVNLTAQTKNLILTADGASNRTLTLLEQERTKYQFFASMSKEIQFEYDFDSDVLTLSEWGADLLGLPITITHPIASDDLARVFSRSDLLEIYKRVRAVSPDNPIFQGNYALRVHGERRWFKAFVRPLWLDEESGELNGAIGKFTDTHEEIIELMRLNRLATHDNLTDLYNRNYARENVENALVEGLTLGKRYAFILFDLDFFKTANDQHGHMFGDEVLIEVADKVKTTLKDSGSLAARLGGDEFLLFTEISDDVEEYIARLYNALNGRYRSYDIELSMGVAIAPDNGKDYDELFRKADYALYSAKKKGRHRYFFYTPEMDGYSPEMDGYSPDSDSENPDADKPTDDPEN